MFSLYLQPIIGYITTIFITIGEAGIVIATGIIKNSIEIMVVNAGIIIIDLVMTVLMTGIATKVGGMTNLLGIEIVTVTGIVIRR
jgi:hypothetical protein